MKFFYVKLILIFTLLLAACNNQTQYNFDTEIKAEEVEYFEYNSRLSLHQKFFDVSVKNSIEFPAYYDYQNKVRNDFFGEKFENMPYYAEGYILDSGKMDIEIPPNFWLIENYLDMEKVIYALDFQTSGVVEQPYNDKLIQVYGYLTGTYYGDYVPHLMVSGKIPEIKVQIIKVNGEIVYGKFHPDETEKKIPLIEVESKLIDLFNSNQVFEALDLYNQLSPELRIELKNVISDFLSLIIDDFNYKLVKYSNPFSETYDIESLKLLLGSVSEIEDVISNDSKNFIENIESIRNLIRTRLNRYDGDIEEYWPEEAEEKTSQFYDVKLEIRKNVESACYFNDLVCDELSDIVSDDFFNVFEFYLSETDGFLEGEKKTTKLSQKNGFQHPTIFFSIPWTSFNGTMPFLSRDYIINKHEDVYEFARIESTQNFKYYARILK